MDLFGFNWVVLLAIAAGMLALRWLRAGMFVWAVAWWLAVLLAVKFGFSTPVPASVLKLYMGITTAAIVVYCSSSQNRLRQTMRPLVELVVETRYRLLLVAILLVIPVLAAFNVYRKLTVAVQAPTFGRTVHPAPPDTITVHETAIDLIRGDNPYRALAARDPEVYARHVANGRRVYFQNCFFCHGDAMAADGVFAPRLNPIPTDFTDKGVLPNLQESYLFWRVSKGGPGLPEEGGPWDSAMPAWESFLSIEEIWDVVLFLYDYTGHQPRALASEEEH